MGRFDIPHMHEITGLGRPLDLSIKSNLIVTISSVSAAALTMFLSWVGVLEIGIFQAAGVGLGVFLSWALMREIDPDNIRGSYLAMGLAAVAGLIAPPAALVIAVLLLTARVVAGTVGSALKPFDMVVLVGAAAVAGSQPIAWPTIGLLAFAVLRSGQRGAKVAGAAIVTAGVVTASVFVESLAPAAPGLGTWVILAVLTIAGWPQIRSPKVVSLADDGSAISPSAVGIARLAVLTAIAGGIVIAPEVALGAMSPAIAAFAAMAFWPRRNPAPEQTLDEPVAVSAPASLIAV